MRLSTILHIVIWPSLLVVGGLLLLTPKDILRQPILPQSGTTRVVAALGPSDIIPATLTVRATALAPSAGVPMLDLADTNVPVTSTPTPSASPSADTRWITAGALNLRDGPSKGARLLASLPYGTPVEVVETSGNWARIEAGGAEGWLSVRFLSTTEPD
jgi:hypothetical protein